MPQFIVLNVLKSRQVTPGGIFFVRNEVECGGLLSADGEHREL